MQEPRPGPANSLADVKGIRVGHAQRLGDGWRTGVTVVLAGSVGMTCGVDVRGGAPGTRETDLLDPRNRVEHAQAVVLTGGSAYGLAAADGVVTRLADAGIGHAAGTEPGQVVPIVPAAVIFDLGRGGSFRATPDAALGAAAYDAALAAHDADAAHGATSGPAGQGSVGAGTGAVAGGFAGGVGSASTVLTGGLTVAALVVANSFGSPVDPRTGELYGTRFGVPGEFGALAPPDPAEVAAWRATLPGNAPQPAGPSPFNTVIGVLATDAALTKAQCARLAGSGHDGLARAIRPAHTMVDGDTIFALAGPAGGPLGLDAFQAVLTAAADAFSRAVAHAVLAAAGRPDAPSYLDVFPSARHTG